MANECTHIDQIRCANDTRGTFSGKSLAMEDDREFSMAVAWIVI
jgi:hypothetical protein